ncbi:MarR family winged helix-turn-helix transcriptional regulator [Aurantiacibacter sp. D1-12]|uniref:MarR family winged helix-turn-helix transcriptional regulator n=1 Tax=Aurantiacibacter sp. D1-12 TaxID=2993658 RepID=UPI00237D0B51|nr:MarR family transcriptional regulator [Aurantiacibacter sp. D1-12]MDE1467930.1 MarR family transcriptional regulator [Aurantiacibacter sp. D1-12]
MAIRDKNGEALTALILEIFRINGQMLSVGNKLTKPYGLTSARWQVIGAIDEEGQALTVSQIARRMGLARQGVQRIINDLEKVGLVESRPNIDHKRAPLFAISDDGEKVMAEVNKAQVEWVNALAEGLSVQDLSSALSLLQTVRERSEEPNS